MFESPLSQINSTCSLHCAFRPSGSERILAADIGCTVCYFSVFFSYSVCYAAYTPCYPSTFSLRLCCHRSIDLHGVMDTTIIQTGSMVAGSAYPGLTVVPKPADAIYTVICCPKDRARFTGHTRCVNMMWREALYLRPSPFAGVRFSLLSRSRSYLNPRLHSR